MKDYSVLKVTKRIERGQKSKPKNSLDKINKLNRKNPMPNFSAIKVFNETIKKLNTLHIPSSYKDMYQLKFEAKTLIGYTLRHFADHCIPECASTNQC